MLRHKAIGYYIVDNLDRYLCFEPRSRMYYIGSIDNDDIIQYNRQGEVFASSVVDIINNRNEFSVNIANNIQFPVRYIKMLKRWEQLSND